MARQMTSLTGNNPANIRQKIQGSRRKIRTPVPLPREIRRWIASRGANCLFADLGPARGTSESRPTAWSFVFQRLLPVFLADSIVA